MRGTVLIVLLASFTLAGCIGGDDLDGSDPDAPAEREEARVTETTGSIEGEVLRDDFEPITGAEVFLVRDIKTWDTLTDSSGQFTFNDLEPGAYRLLVAAPCCKDHVTTIEIAAGEVTSADVQLERIPALQAYVDTNGEWEGLIACGATYPTAFQPFNCPDSNSNDEQPFVAELGLETIVVAMDWEETGTNLQNTLRLYLCPETCGNLGQNSIAQNDSEPPIEYKLNAKDGVEGLDWGAAEEPLDFLFRVRAGDSGGLVNVVYQQRFTVYYHLFYGESAPSGYSALPDG